ncbi:ATP-dependent DNA ligase [Branchiibius sp. NY16-3462-2]|uniref:ATP-dependent DNA ligase n=1 Tax=Branchiibius sp. NY16-3462-2 TaxID=1807500 RepID=UPI0007932C0B|nr:ATP-dependent DNA ligase [Branchiibius sp. NY16-3462-2]KYH44448.1 hypothetical protein AZH51_07980 [Branchiibius sp. NY16-3462-2]
MLLSQIVEVSGRVGSTRARNAKIAKLASVLRAADADDVPLVTAYLTGTLPQRRPGVGWRSVRDLPSAALEPSLSVRDVDAAVSAMERLSGPGSAAARAALVADLFGAATPDEQRFLVGLFTGELRHGAQDGVMQSAIAEAFEVPLAGVRRAAMLAGDLTDVAATARSFRTAGLEQVGLQVGRPLRPMLAGSAASVDAAYGDDDAQRFDVECKLDGIRLQAHKDGDRVWLFTRSLDDITDRLPEVVAVVRGLPVQTAVLDGEAIALRADGRPEPFQVTGARTASADGVPVTTFFFDLLHVDGRTLLDEPLQARIASLEQVVAPEHRIPRRAGADLAGARAAFAEWVAGGHEGVVLKDPDVVYAAGRRGAGWIKVKPRHTLDLVVLAVERGSGRRSEWLSNIHLGARDPQTGEFVMVGKTFKGMTDEMLRWQTQRFTDLADGPADGWTVRVRPEQVVEVAFDGVQRSSRYAGGVALRFARVLRYRDDKGAEAADSIEELRGLL